MVNFLGAIGQGAVIAITIKAIDDFSSTFKRFGTRVGKMEIIAKAGATAVIGMGAALTAMAVSSIKVAADFEQTQIAFETMLGSAADAEKLLNDLAEFAQKTPFTLKGIETATKRLLAYGVEQKDVIRDLENLGNIAAGVGTEKLPNLITAFGQVRAKTVLAGQELLQFTEAGVPLAELLSEVTGFDVKDIVDQTKDLGISFEEVREALGLLSGEGGRFFNLMALQAETVKGKFSNIEDAVGLLQRAMGVAFLPVLNKISTTIINDLIPDLDELAPKLGENLAEAAEDFFEAIEPLIPEILDLVAAFIDLIPTFVNIIIPAFLIFVQVLGDVLSVITKVIDAIVAFDKKFKASKFASIAGQGAQILLGGIADISTGADPRSRHRTGQVSTSAFKGNLLSDAGLLTSSRDNVFVNIESVSGFSSQEVSNSLLETLNNKVRI